MSSASDTTAAGSVEAARIRPGSVRAWLLASRPKTLAAAIAPVAAGTAVAYATGGARALPALAALGGAIAIQIGTNFANDVFDYEKGADTGDRLGPLRAAQAGLLTPRGLRAGMIAAFAAATACGAYLAAAAGWPIVVIGIASIVSGIAYTGGPWPLGYHGLGDLFVFVFFGLVAVAGTTFVQTGDVPALAWLAAIPVGALATAILAVNNVRDEETDRVAGKRTVVARFGRRAGVAEYALLLAASAVAVGAIAWREHSPWPLLALALLPEGVRLSRAVARDRGAALNPTLGATARLLAGSALLLSLGVVLGGR